jgi:hypothetical protein
VDRRFIALVREAYRVGKQEYLRGKEESVKVPRD